MDGGSGGCDWPNCVSGSGGSATSYSGGTGGGSIVNLYGGRARKWRYEWWCRWVFK